MATEQAAEKLSFKQLLGKATASQAAEELRTGRLWEGPGFTGCGKTPISYQGIALTMPHADGLYQGIALAIPKVFRNRSPL